MWAPRRLPDAQNLQASRPPSLPCLSLLSQATMGSQCQGIIGG